MDLNQMNYFVEVVKNGSFSKASRALGIPKSTLSRKVLDLEEHLGVDLLRRTTRRQTLTSAGEEYYHSCVKILSQIFDIEKSISRTSSEKSGRIRFTAPADADQVLAPLIHEFSKKNPEISFELRLTDRMVDLVSEGFDLAMRFGPLKNSSLIAKKIGLGGMRLYASSDYLKRAGHPKSPKELSERSCVLFAPNMGDVFWSISDGRNRFKLKMKDQYRFSSLALCRRLVEMGMGIGALPYISVSETKVHRDFVPVLPQYHFEQRAIYLVYPEQKQMAPSLRAFIDFIVTEFPSLA